MDRLRSVFQRAAQFDMSASFKIASDGMQRVMSMTTGAIQVSVDRWGSVMGSGIDALLASVEAKLAATSNSRPTLQRCPGPGSRRRSSSRSYRPGLSTGNSMAEAILSASPETQAQARVAIRAILKPRRHRHGRVGQVDLRQRGLATERTRRGCTPAHRPIWPTHWPRRTPPSPRAWPRSTPSSNCVC